MGIQSQGKVEMLREAFTKLGLGAKRKEVEDFCWKMGKMSVAPQWVERMRAVMLKEKTSTELGAPAANNGQHEAPTATAGVEDKKAWAENMINRFEKEDTVPKVTKKVTTPAVTPVAATPISQPAEKGVLTAKEETVSLVQIVLDAQQLIAVMGGKEHLKALIDVL